MDLSFATGAGRLSPRVTDRRRATTEAAVRDAERRVLERATATRAAPRREYTERGRHAAPRQAGT
jgi:hypothetical protein